MEKVSIKVKDIVMTTVSVYGGKIHGDDGAMLDVEFETLMTAAGYIGNFALGDVARVRSDENGVSQTAFNKPVVVQFDISQDEADA